MRRLDSTVFALALAVLAGPLTALAQAQEKRRPLVPETFSLAPAVRQAIAAEWLTEDERRDLRVFHGVWDDQDLEDPRRRALVAISNWDLANPVLDDPAVPRRIRAEAKLLAGHLRDAVALLEGDDSFGAARIRAEAYETLGDRRAADDEVDEPVRGLQRQKLEDAVELTEGVRALVVRSRLRGQPSRDFQTMLNLLGRAHQEIDRLYWPAKLVEAHLLLDKDHDDEAVDALHETLTLNPRCSEAWFALGRVAIARFDFGSAAVAAEALQRQRSDHPLADMLLAESRLIQDDPDGALDLLVPVVQRYPRLRPAYALIAAARAISYDEEALREALAVYEALSPGSPQAYYVVGRHLSFNRQYDAAAAALEEAIRRQPTWPTPQIELGLLELQSGKEVNALDALKNVAELDPFNKRAANSLFLLEEMAAYGQIETEHFVVRYRPGIDEVMVDMMPERLERIHETVSGRFGFEPDRKTVIELMPDHKRFSVRITGMPWIHTVAACTGPVIALEPPREGKKSEHLGLFDWPRVLQHEYTHTITLAQTRNRIPHWLTEAAAVSMELSPRPYGTCQVLTQSYQDGTLFDLDEIKWAFVRPRRPGDRSKAYAQGHWMVQFMNERFGSSALIRLLEQYFLGKRESEAMPIALGISREAFFAQFLDWAAVQVEAWGLGAEPTVRQLTDEIRFADPVMAREMERRIQTRLDMIAQRVAGQIGQPRTPRSDRVTARDWPDIARPPVEITDEQLAAWLETYPEHPDLYELYVRRAMDRGGVGDDELVAMLERYASLRPVDPMPHKKLARIWLDSETPQRSVPHLETLDGLEEKTPVYAARLARLYREAGDTRRAHEKATRALHIDPYHAPNRELAAAVAIEAGDVEAAHLHIRALTLIEPERPQHKKRLERIEALLARLRRAG